MESVSGVFVPVELLAREQGVPVETIVERIQGGELIGRRQSNGWHVLVRVPPGEHTGAGAGGGAGAGAGAGAAVPGAAVPGATAPGRVLAELDGPVTLAGRPEVVVRNLDIGLGTLVGLVIKLVVATLIAALILGGIGFGLMLLVEAYGQGLVDMLLDLIGPYLQ